MICIEIDFFVSGIISRMKSPIIADRGKSRLQLIVPRIVEKKCISEQMVTIKRTLNMKQNIRYKLNV